MGQLLAFLYKFRAFFTFLILEVFCIWLIVSNNNYQKTVFINSAAGLVGTVNESANEITDYFSLARVNRELAEENERLRAELLNRPESLDSLVQFDIDPDTTDTVQYQLRTAEVIDNTTNLANNLFMINKGSRDGIEPGMGVITSKGIAGKVRSVGKRYSRVVSVLNTRNPISARHLSSQRMGSVQWDGVDSDYAKLLFITRETVVEPGDTIITSGFNAIYPKGLMIGIVSEVKPDPNQRDLDIKLKLSVDFRALEYVYVIENQYIVEKDSLIENDPLSFE